MWPEIIRFGVVRAVRGAQRDAYLPAWYWPMDGGRYSVWANRWAWRMP